MFKLKYYRYGILFLEKPFQSRELAELASKTYINSYTPAMQIEKKIDATISIIKGAKK